eukprot:CAMPEP_0117783100 /NCGR_PEP_ID=MMETSP0948-20121206/3832_1 /TAXON_ID=44440 /ORGANISM="Chattonella subsalsa, Strain CCMP2191" /LENGTH=113 /DNA_ID=CAMNT_0005611441 /DNA_START=70 /DNA_END=411 /DNA_ORIENTATION=-
MRDFGANDGLRFQIIILQPQDVLQKAHPLVVTQAQAPQNTAARSLFASSAKRQDETVGTAGRKATSQPGIPHTGNRTGNPRFSWAFDLLEPTRYNLHPPPPAQDPTRVLWFGF